MKRKFIISTLCTIFSIFIFCNANAYYSGCCGKKCNKYKWICCVTTHGDPDGMFFAWKDGHESDKKTCYRTANRAYPDDQCSKGTWIYPTNLTLDQACEKHNQPRATFHGRWGYR